MELIPSASVVAPIATVLWPLVTFFLLRRHARTGAHVGLLLAYVISLTMLHWSASALQVLPWYQGLDREATVEGLRQSFVALLGLAAGAEIASRWGRRLEHSHAFEGTVLVPERIVNMCLACAVVIYGLSFSALAGVPSVGALVSVSPMLFVAGVALKCWNAWHAQRWARAYAWLASTVSFPALTVLVYGFLGVGLGAMLAVYTFFASMRRPRWKVLATAAVLAYLCMSIYTTYMRDRGAIRDVVWRGGTMVERAGRLRATMEDFEWFDPRDEAHLLRVDGRLNQNALVGSAVFFLEDRRTPYAAGATVWQALAAIVPRVLWPDKPDVAGSGNLVSEFTGMRFAAGTSVGIGHVLEWYVNFGTAGILVGFIIIGFVLIKVDGSAARHLSRGNGTGFMQWYVPGLSLLNVGGSLSEAVATAAAGYLVVRFVYGVTWVSEARSGATLPAGIDPRAAPHSEAMGR